MRFKSARSYVFTILLPGLIVLIALLLIAKPAFSLPRHNPKPASAAAVASLGSNASTVTVTATDSMAAESGANPGEFTIARSDTAGDLTVKYDVGGTATNGTDYAALSGTVTIASGTASVTLPVTPIDDATQEGDETVIVTLTADPNYTIGTPGSDTVTIADDDLPIRISQDPIGKPWLYLFDPFSGRLFQGPNTTGARVLLFSIDRETGRGRIYRGANATGEILFTVGFRTGRIWAGPNETGPLLYTLDPVPSSNTPEVRVHAGRANGPILYTIHDDDVYDGPNVTGPLVLHGSRPFWGPVQFLLPLLADNLVP